MVKKLFSFFITSLVVAAGIVMVPGGVDALMPFVQPDRSCQIGGIIETAFFFENTNPDGQPSGYYLDVYVTESEPIPSSVGASICPPVGLARSSQYFFPLNMLSVGLADSLLENKFIDFIIDDNSNYINPVITEKVVLDICSIKGEMLRNFPPNPPITPVMCGEGYTYPCQTMQSLVSVKITSVNSTVSGQCNSRFSIGQEKDFFVSHLDVQGYTTDPVIGKKVTINGELTEKGFYPLTASIFENNKPDQDPEDPEDPKDEDDSDDEEEQGEIIPNDPVSSYPTQNSNFGMGVIAGLLGGLIVLVITLLIKRKK